MGLAHCIEFECAMNGSNSMAESDGNPLAFCPLDEQKLWWAFKLEPAPRLQAMAEFAASLGLNEEAALWRAQAEALK